MTQCNSKFQRSKKDDSVVLIGLDFGSTTSNALVARANVESNCVTGRMEFGNPQVVYRSRPVFTPFTDDSIDRSLIERYLDEWFEQSDIRPEDIFAGGTIITGLAARSANAAVLTRLVTSRIGESIIATADDPCLESWLAFMGSCSTLSRYNAETAIVNLDIGGGTTNPALGVNGVVQSTGCYFVGARHFRFHPGTYVLSGLSEYGQELSKHLGIRKEVGSRFDLEEIEKILDYYVLVLEAVVSGDRTFPSGDVDRLHEQVRFHGAEDIATPAVTFSGGVGELVYKYAAGETLPDTTHFGDLGTELAVRVASSPILSRDLKTLVPENKGRATVYGLTLHNTEVSGTTLFLPRPESLPLRNLPVVARLTMDAGAPEIQRALSLVRKSRQGACVQIVSDESETQEGKSAGSSLCQESVKALGQRLAKELINERLAADKALVILTSKNAGKTIGNYATDWKQLPCNLIVIDEVPIRNADFVNIGCQSSNIVPVSYYGMH